MAVPKKRTSASKKRIRKKFWKKKGYRAALKAFSLGKSLSTGKILSRRVNRLTLKQQRLITIAINKLVFYLCYLFSIMRNNLKESSRPPERLVLEPEINRLILFLSELKRGLVFCLTNWRIQISLRCRKKKKRTAKKIFFNKRVHSF